jgi:hypothetical protein
MQFGPLVLGLVLAATIGTGCKALPDVPPAAKAREVHLKDPYTVVIEVRPRSGLLGGHYCAKGASGADSARVEMSVSVKGKMPPYVLKLSPEQIAALDRQLQRDTPTLVNLEFSDMDLHAALAQMGKEAEEKDEEATIHVKTVLYYSFYFGKKVRESAEEVEMEVED